MKFDVLTLFPEMFEPLKESIIKRATEKNLIDINLINIRDFSEDKHMHVDDTPYGGGAGMLMKPDVVGRAVASVKTEKSKVIYLSPRGKTLNQNKVKSLAESDHLILLCGHYMVLIDSVSRYVPGVLTEESTDEESFSEGLLEYPQYTRPEIFDGVRVPEVLLSGHHENIKKWRRLESLRITYKNRPELLENVVLTDEEKDYIEKLKKEVQE